MRWRLVCAITSAGESEACLGRSPRHRNESGEENSGKAARDGTARDDDGPVGHDFAEALRDAMSQRFGRVRGRRTMLGLRRMMQAPEERSS